MDKFPFEDQLVIDELVEYWQTGKAPVYLYGHIRDTSKPGGRQICLFFLKVYKDLYTGKRSQYAALSASEFKQFLEDEYHPLNKQREEWERLARAIREENERKARAEHEENERKARADFDALGKEMAKATTRKELIELGRKRVALAPYTGTSYVYENHCFRCKRHISSAIHARCPSCGWYICSCGACGCEWSDDWEGADRD